MGMGKEEGRDAARLIKTKNLWGEKKAVWKLMT